MQEHLRMTVVRKDVCGYSLRLKNDEIIQGNQG